MTSERFLHKDKVRRFAGKCSLIHQKVILRLISSTIDVTLVLHETLNHCAISCMSAKFILAIVVLKPNTFPQTNWGNQYSLQEHRLNAPVLVWSALLYRIQTKYDCNKLSFYLFHFICNCGVIDQSKLSSGVHEKIPFETCSCDNRHWFRWVLDPHIQTQIIKYQFQTVCWTTWKSVSCSGSWV